MQSGTAGCGLRPYLSSTRGGTTAGWSREQLGRKVNACRDSIYQPGIDKGKPGVTRGRKATGLDGVEPISQPGYRSPHVERLMP